MSRGPVILLAIADARGDLPELREEGRQLQELFGPLHAAGRCQLVMLPYATLGGVYAALQEHRDRIAVFHFGGHADPGRVMLDKGLGDGDEDVAGARAEGLARLLGQQRGLNLVFLNGCATRPQVRLLTDAGVPAVIATARPIKDREARVFAVAFYQALMSRGSGLAAAFAATDALAAARGDGPTRYLKAGGLAADDVADDRGMPWDLRVRDGSEAVERWHPLDDDPLLGVPPLPADIPAPADPFRRLEWFGREHARIFFGRGRAIRELHELLTRPAAPADARVVLYYGQTGVGKTSVLAAGLLPRLEASHAVRYRRRASDRSLFATLQDALVPADPAKPAVVASDPGAAWPAAEQAAGRPLIVVLDQAEEAYTRPLTAPTDGRGPDGELHALAAAVRATFDATLLDRPLGRLVLSFRKEWLDEFQRALRAVGVAFESVPLAPLDRAGVVEAVEGPASVPKYRLAVEPSRDAATPGEPPLAEFVADDLLAALADPKANALSPVAPALQILLTRMWAAVKHQDRRTFDRGLYVGLKARGFHLAEVLDQQLAEIARDDPAAVETGLVLDLLNHFTTPLGTAATRTRGEVLDRYPRQPADRLAALLHRCQDRYLLAEVVTEAGTAYRLVHDTLGPLVRDRWNRSLDPGPRASRTLGKRALEWSDGRSGPPLDRHDLAAVEAAAPVLPRWTPDEERLLAASRAAEARRLEAEAEQQRRVRDAEDASRRATELRLEAEAGKRREAESRVEEQAAAHRRLRQRAYVLAVMVVGVFFAGVVAGIQWWNARTAQEQTQDTLARSFVRSLGQRPGEKALNPVEVDALWDLATLPDTDEPVRFAFLRQALSESAGGRLESKIVFAVHAAVGLDRRRRGRAIRQVVLPLLTSTGSTAQVRLHAVAAAAVMEEAARDGLLDRDSVRDEILVALRTLISGSNDRGSNPQAQRVRKIARVVDRVVQSEDGSRIKELSI